MTLFRKRQPVKAYWWNAIPNFGDQLAPLLLARFASIDVQWDTVSRSQVVSIGSLLEHVPPLWEGYILGTGKLYPDSRVHLYGDGLHVLALRGPLSKRAWRGDCAIGDPGLLADELIEPQSRTIDLGIVPHWSDRSLAGDKRFFGNWTRIVIDPASDPLTVVSQIGQCRKIVASSLHGLILADAFGIPRRFEYTDRFDQEGGKFKFEDYSASIGMQLEVGSTQKANRNRVEDRKHELWDAYRQLGALLST